MHRGSISAGCATSPIYVLIHLKCAGMIPSPHERVDEIRFISAQNISILHNVHKTKRIKGPQNMLGIYICRSRKKKRVKLPQTQSKDGNTIDILRHWTDRLLSAGSPTHSAGIDK
jgi:hypothetical protein